MIHFLLIRHNRLVLADLYTDFTAYALIGINIDRPFSFMPVFGLTDSFSPAYGRAVDLKAHLATTAVVHGDSINRVLELFQRLGTA